MSEPLIVCITTLPSRIGLLRPTLESLLSGQKLPQAIRIIVPDRPLRETAEYAIPPFLLDTAFHGGLVEIVKVERDWGPGSKLLGGLQSITEPSVLVVADDDVRYRADFLQGLWEAQHANHHVSFSYYTYRVGGITIGQGCDGFSFWTPNLDGIFDFFDRHVNGTDIMFHDDFWISFFLAAEGISIESLGHKLDGGLIYEQVHEINALRHLDGALVREDLNRRGYAMLMKSVPLPVARRLDISMRALSQKYFVGQISRVRRSLDKVLAR